MISKAFPSVVSVNGVFCDDLEKQVEEEVRSWTFELKEHTTINHVNQERSTRYYEFEYHQRIIVVLKQFEDWEVPGDFQIRAVDPFGTAHQYTYRLCEGKALSDNKFRAFYGVQ